MSPVPDPLAEERQWARAWERALATEMRRLDKRWGLAPLEAAPPRHVWTESELHTLRQLYARTLTEQLARQFGMKPESVYRKAMKLGLKKDPECISQWARERTAQPGHPSRAYRFQKGIVPANKGLRQPGFAPGRMGTTQFRKGNRPHTWRPIGTLSVNTDGYLVRKVSDTGYGPRDWVGVHRLVWMEAHGPIPEGHVVVFRPGRKTTDPQLITEDAVELLTHRELMARNTVHRYPPEIVAAVVARGRLVRAINRKAKEHE